jgi:zinc D-Ala-D-Ala carboxypeptidase
MKLSEHFERTEFERDGCVIPDEDIVAAYRFLCSELLEPIRTAFPEPFYIDSGYRSLEVNKRIGGVLGSQHVATGSFAAADFYLESYRSTMQAVFDWIRMSQLLFDQVILEHGKNGDIIHISWAKKYRRQALEGATFNQSAYTARFSAPIVEAT